MHMGPRRTNRGPMLFRLASAIPNRDASSVLGQKRFGSEG